MDKQLSTAERKQQSNALLSKRKQRQNPNNAESSLSGKENLDLPLSSSPSFKKDFDPQSTTENSNSTIGCQIKFTSIKLQTRIPMTETFKRYLLKNKSKSLSLKSFEKTEVTSSVDSFNTKRKTSLQKSFDVVDQDPASVTSTANAQLPQNSSVSETSLVNNSEPKLASASTPPTDRQNENLKLETSCTKPSKNKKKQLQAKPSVSSSGTNETTMPSTDGSNTRPTLSTLTFKKRPGTTDVGKDYEDLTLARCLLEMIDDHHVDQFLIWSNDDQYGAFDDVIVEIETKGTVIKKYALQLGM